MNQIKKPTNIIVIIIAMAFFMEWLDAYALNTSFPVIGTYFHTSPLHIKEALTLYLLSVGFFIPLNSRVVNRFGIKPVYCFSIIVFVIGSIGCGFANSALMLTIFRVVQGFGGAFLTPLGRLIMIHAFGKEKIAVAMAKVTMIITFAMVLGPLLGGAFATWLSWRYIFFINIPIGLFGLYCIKRYLPEYPVQENTKRFDWLGFLMLGGALALALAALDAITDPSIAWWLKGSVLALTAVLIFSFVQRLRYAKQPLYPRSLFSYRFTRSLFASFIARLGLMSPVFLLPLMLQNQYNYLAVEAGLCLLPMALMTPFGKNVLKNVLKYRSAAYIAKRLSFINAALLLAFAFLALHFSLLGVLLASAALGFTIFAQPTVMNTIIYQAADEMVYAEAVSCNSAVIQLGASFAIAVAAMVLLFFGHASDVAPYGQTAFATTFAVAAAFPVIGFWLIRKLS